MQLSLKQQFQIKNKDLKTALIKTLFQELKHQWNIVKTAQAVKQPNGTISYIGKNKALKRIRQIGAEVSRRKKAEKSLTKKVIKCQNYEK